MRRWGRYQAPVMVCVELDEEDGDRIITGVLGEEAQDLEIMRAQSGTPLVYDENMHLLEPGDPGADRAGREAEDRQWPESAAWESGPDALRHPGLYDPDTAEDEDTESWPDVAADHDITTSAQARAHGVDVPHQMLLTGKSAP